MYKDIINHDSIGSDLDLLFSYVGEENFNRLVDFVNLNYGEINYSEVNLLELDKILSDMQIHSKKRIKK